MTSHIGFQDRNAARGGRVVFAAAVLFGCLQSVALGAGPVGLWYAEGGAAEVEIRPCSDVRPSDKALVQARARRRALLPSHPEFTRRDVTCTAKILRYFVINDGNSEG
jgi:hypothetical protein